ncbi:MAG: class I SAM-dependent methyltransferase [Acidimicrobiales bacterium]
MSASPFDELAAGYDASFTHTELGRRYRRAVQRRMELRFAPGGRVLELNCGTGEDALALARRGVSVLATDASEAMLAEARAKLAGAGAQAAGRVELRRLSLEELAGAAADLGRFDGALSNFGGLNCTAELAGVAAGLAAALRPGAPAILCVMGPTCPWEWAWRLAHPPHRDPFRRLRKGLTWRGLPVRYPSVGALRRVFRPQFRCDRVWALGALLPPPCAEAWAARRPALVERLDRLERRVEAAPGLAWLADHYVVELSRR